MQSDNPEVGNYRPGQVVDRSLCPLCSADMRIVAFSKDGGPVRRILKLIGKSDDPQRIAPARGPPFSEAEASSLPLPDPIVQPEPDLQFEQTMSW